METRSRRFAHASASMSGYSLSLNKLEADILQGGPGWLHKKNPVTHMRKFVARASLIRPFVEASLGHFSLSREHHPAVMRSFALLVDATMNFCSRGKPLRFSSQPVSCIYIRDRYNEPLAEHNYFTLLTRSMTLSVRILWTLAFLKPRSLNLDDDAKLGCVLYKNLIRILTNNWKDELQ